MSSRQWGSDDTFRPSLQQTTVSRAVRISTRRRQRVYLAVEAGKGLALSLAELRKGGGFMFGVKMRELAECLQCQKERR